jgi:tetratricopeptide (TPR) repeat protein
LRAYSRSSAIYRDLASVNRAKGRPNGPAGRRDPDDVASHWRDLFSLELNGRGSLEERRRDIGEAMGAARRGLSDIERAIALVPDKTSFWIDRGDAHKMLGRLARAATPPDFPTAERECQLARLEFERLIKRNPHDGESWNRLFLVYYDGIAPLWERQHRRDLQIEAYKSAVRAAEEAASWLPKDPIVNNNLYYAHGTLADLLGQDSSVGRGAVTQEYKRSVRAVEHAIALDPHAARYQAELALSQLSLAKLTEAEGAESGPNFERAVRASSQAVRLSRASASNLNLQAVTEIARGTRLANALQKEAASKALEDARDAAERATKLDPNEPQYQKTLFEAERALSRLAPPGTSLEGSRRRRAFLAVLRAGELFEEKKDFSNADHAYGEAVKLEPVSSPLDEDQIAVARLYMAVERSAGWSSAPPTPEDQENLRKLHEMLMEILRRLDAAQKLPPEWRSKLP